LAVTGLAGVGTVWTFAALAGSAYADGTGVFVTFVSVLLVLAGLLMARRRPHSWSGPLLELTSMLALGGQARFGAGQVSAAGGAVWLAAILLPGALALAEVGVSKRALRAFLLGPVALSVLLGTAVVLAAHGRVGADSLWWQTARQQAGYPLARALFVADTAVAVVSLAFVFGALVHKLLGADRASLRVLRPVAVPAAIWALATTSSQLACLPGPAWALGTTVATFNTPGTFVLFLAPLLSMAGLFGGVVWVELVEPRLVRTSAGIALSPRTGSRDVRSYVAGALGDPSVRVVFRSADQKGWVGPDGKPGFVAEDDPERAVTIIERRGLEIGAVEYDASLTSEPDAIELVLTAAGLVIENERLAALSKSRAEDARRLAAALVSSAGSARDEVRAQLERGPLADLAAIEAELSLGGDLERAARALQEAASEVRHISHGLYPAELADGGLAAALTQAAEVPDGRFPRAIEVTAFLAADGDSEARVKVGPGALTIALSKPPGSAALLERVAVLGGAVEGNAIVLPLADLAG
jgi:energy-converting hydrogenase Eha subunit A